MAVIINEFEVLTEPPRQQEGQSPEVEAVQQQQPQDHLSPFTLEMIWRRLLQRQARVTAD